MNDGVVVGDWVGAAFGFEIGIGIEFSPAIREAQRGPAPAIP